MINIALDGPAGSGKSTVAKILAKKLNVLYLDTGAMYRACALESIEKKVDRNSEKEVENMLKNTTILVKYVDGKQITYLNGEDVSEKIRNNEVSIASAEISVHPCVREKMVLLQKAVAKENDCVLDGRDIGTHVLPDSNLKFFLTASVEERAKRRYNELKSKNVEVDFDTLKKEIEQRDYTDSHRKISPLKIAKDALVIDSSNLSAEEVAEIIYRKVKENVL